LTGTTKIKDNIFVVARLRDYSWWPSSWTLGINPGQVRLKGIFKACRHSRTCLTLAVDYERQTTEGFITPEPGLDLKRLHDFLQRHYGKPMQEVDSLEFECDSVILL
jgi:hypothetical protein